MRSRRFAPAALTAWLVCLGALAGCPSKNGPYTTYTPSEGGTPNTPTGFGGSTGTPPSNFDAGPPNGSVDIQVHSPMAGAMLSVNAAADVSAKVSIVGGTDLVDPSSVRMTIAQTGSSMAISTAPLTGPSGDMEYKGKLSLAGLKSGDYDITVSARSTTGAANQVTVKVTVDAGPQITVLSPVPGAHYKTSLFVQIAVDGGTIGLSGDPTASIGGMPVALAPAGPANQWRGAVDLEKPVALQGDQLFVVSATNKNGTRTEIRFVFVVDITGPTVTMTTPAPGAIVGNIIRLAADIRDGAGLNESSLQVLIGDQTTPLFRLALRPEPGSSTYSVLFDTKNLTLCKLTADPCIVRPTISFRAADLLGNETTISYEIAVDNIPPIADLVPPRIHDSKRDMGLRCSHAFDPLDHDIVAGDAPDDLCVVPQLFDLRARIEDDGNHATGLKQIPISTVDPDRTAAYILDQPVVNGEAQPLVVDTDGDGWCDAINPKLEPTTSPLSGPRQVLKVRMVPVPVGGAADFATPTQPPYPPLPSGCLPGLDVDVPLNRCKPGPQPSIAISYVGLPAIWTIEPVAPANPNYCFGSQLDTKANNIKPVVDGTTTRAEPTGWKCIAIATADMNGNTSTSAPIRVYLHDYLYGGADDFPGVGLYDHQFFCTQPLPAGAGPPPSCTGTYDKATGTVSQKACKTRNFKPAPGDGPEICFMGDCGIPHFP